MAVSLRSSADDWTLRGVNYLAHLWLAGPHESLRLGGVIGDFVKGRLPAGLPPDLAAGVALHRSIDAFADRHSAFRAARARVSAHRRRFAGVMVDMFFDHFLAAHWSRYHPGETLAAFSRRQYAMFGEQMDRLPAEARPVIARMRESDWLGAYAHRDVIERALDRIAQRLRRPEPFLGSGAELSMHYEAFAVDCERFFADASVYAAETGPALLHGANYR